MPAAPAAAIVDNEDGIGVIHLFIGDGMGLVRLPIKFAKPKTTEDLWDPRLLGDPDDKESEQ